MNKLMKKKKKGFTLIELIAVIAILAILAVVAVPRVIQYVDKSKKVAIQTEASTIYNAAEAAYNDGKLTKGEVTKGKVTKGKVTTDDNKTGSTTTNDYVENSKDFDDLPVADAVKSLKSQDLLSADTNLTKFGSFKESIKLSDLKDIMNANADNINIDSKGELTGVTGSTSLTAKPEE